MSRIPPQPHVIARAPAGASVWGAGLENTTDDKPRWDGRRWISPDGSWWWSGTQWVAVGSTGIGRAHVWSLAAVMSNFILGGVALVAAANADTPEPAIFDSLLLGAVIGWILALLFGFVAGVFAARQRTTASPTLKRLLLLLLCLAAVGSLGALVVVTYGSALDLRGQSSYTGLVLGVFIFVIPPALFVMAARQVVSRPRSDHY
jgi:hypothetical protein